MTQQVTKAPTKSTKDTHSGSRIGRMAGFIAQHPIGVVQVVFFSLVGIIILQNLESTSIDLLFWSVAALPKLVLIFLSMLVGAASWEMIRRWLLR